MNLGDLIKVIAVGLPPAVAKDLSDNFMLIRQDASSGTLGRASPGKFVETVVQALQHLEGAQVQAAPEVDRYLRELDSRPAKLPDGLRFCAGRLARAMYTFRNKRNILHKNDINPSGYDLRLLFHAAQWIMAEFLRVIGGDTMDVTGKLIDAVQAPAGAMIEDFAGKRLVLVDVSVKEEAILVLHSHHPSHTALPMLVAAMDRRAEDTVRKAVREMWAARLVEGDSKSGYLLTARGVAEAQRVFAQHAAL
jgi:hypothetical protein